MSLESDSWKEYSRHVLAELKRLNSNLITVDEKIDRLKVEQSAQQDRLKDDHITPLKLEIAMLRVKSSVWGLMGGAIPATLLLVAYFLKEVSK